MQNYTWTVCGIDIQRIEGWTEYISQVRYEFIIDTTNKILICRITEKKTLESHTCIRKEKDGEEKKEEERGKSRGPEYRDGGIYLPIPSRNACRPHTKSEQVLSADWLDW